MPELINIEITPLDAELFLKFQKNHELFLLLQQHGIFDIQFGKAVLNFQNGLLQNITKEEVLYKRP